jgi:hypothetical protein
VANYTIKFSSTDNSPDRFPKKSFVIPESGVNDTSTALVLHGALSTDYGKDIWNNMVYLLENFCNDAPPDKNTLGQLWFNSTTNTLNVYRADSNGLLDYMPLSPIEFNGTKYITDKPFASDHEVNYITSDSTDFDAYFITKKYASDHFLSIPLGLDGSYLMSKPISYSSLIDLTKVTNPETLVTKKYVDGKVGNFTVTPAGVGLTGALGGVRIKNGGGITIDPTTSEISLTDQPTTTAGGTKATANLFMATTPLNGFDPASATNDPSLFSTVGYVDRQFNTKYATTTTAGTIKIGGTLQIATDGVVDIVGFSKDTTKPNNPLMVNTPMRMADKMPLTSALPHNGIALNAPNCECDDYFVTKSYVYNLVANGVTDSAIQYLTYTSGTPTGTLKTKSYLRVGEDTDGVDDHNGIDLPANATFRDRLFTTVKFAEDNFVTKITDPTKFSTKDDDIQTVSGKLQYGNGITAANIDNDNTLIHKGYITSVLGSFIGTGGIASKLAIKTDGGSQVIEIATDSVLKAGSDDNGILQPADAKYDRYFLTKHYADTHYIKRPTTAIGWLNNDGTSISWKTPFWTKWTETPTTPTTPTTTCTIPAEQILKTANELNGIADNSTSITTYDGHLVNNKFLYTNYIQIPPTAVTNRVLTTDTNGAITWAAKNWLPATNEPLSILTTSVDGKSIKWLGATKAKKVLVTTADAAGQLSLSWADNTSMYWGYATSELKPTNIADKVVASSALNGIITTTNNATKPVSPITADHSKFTTSKYVLDNFPAYGTFESTRATKPIINKLSYSSSVAYDTTPTKADEFTLIHKKYVDDIATKNAMFELTQSSIGGVTTNVNTAMNITVANDELNGYDAATKKGISKAFVTHNVLTLTISNAANHVGDINAAFNETINTMNGDINELNKISDTYFAFAGTLTTSNNSLKSKTDLNGIPKSTIDSNGIPQPPTDPKYDNYFTTKTYCEQNYSKKLPKYPADTTKSYVLVLSKTTQELSWGTAVTTDDLPQNEPGLFYIVG